MHTKAHTGPQTHPVPVAPLSSSHPTSTLHFSSPGALLPSPQLLTPAEPSHSGHTLPWLPLFAVSSLGPLSVSSVASLSPSPPPFLYLSPLPLSPSLPLSPLPQSLSLPCSPLLAQFRWQVTFSLLLSLPVLDKSSYLWLQLSLIFTIATISSTRPWHTPVLILFNMESRWALGISTKQSCSGASVSSQQGLSVTASTN